MIIGRDLIESQKLYSTGNDDLDKLLEMAFSDGYEYAQREYSKIEDEDYYDDIEKARKGDNQAAMIALPVTLGVGGAMIGGAIGESAGISKNKKANEIGKKMLRGALAGGVAGTAGGILIGRRIKKKNNEKYDKKRDRYKFSSERDKKYLRHRREIEDKERNDNRRTAALASSIGSLKY